MPENESRQERLGGQQAERSEKRDLYKLFLPIARTLLDLNYYRILEGLDNIPEEPALFVSNHIQAVDSPLIALTYSERTGKPMRFVAKQEYFDGRGIDDHGKYGKSAKFLMEHIGAIPADRQMKNLSAIKELGLHINAAHERGEATGMHPEGTRRDDGHVHKFRAGAGSYALEYGFSIVPVGVRYFEKGSHPGSRRQPVLLNFGEPIRPDSFHEPPISLLPGRRMKADYINEIAEKRVAELAHLPRSGVVAQLRHQLHLPEN